jgi:hypothetical protein
LGDIRARRCGRRAASGRDNSQSGEVLTKDKKSSDRKYLLALLMSAVESADLIELKKFLEYLGARLQILKEPLGTAMVIDRNDVRT